VTEFNDLQERQGARGGALFPIADFLYPFGFRLITSYTEQVFPEGDLFVVSNALFVLPVEHHVGKRPPPRRRVTAVARSRPAGSAGIDARRGLCSRFASHARSASGGTWGSPV
jgi:hypothetical protein